MVCIPLTIGIALQDEMIAYVRRKSAAFSRGKSKYRGVSGQSGRWEARIGAYCGRKNVSCSSPAGILSVMFQARSDP